MTREMFRSCILASPNPEVRDLLTEETHGSTSVDAFDLNEYCVNLPALPPTGFLKEVFDARRHVNHIFTKSRNEDQQNKMDRLQAKHEDQFFTFVHSIQNSESENSVFNDPNAYKLFLGQWGLNVSKIKRLYDEETHSETRDALEALAKQMVNTGLRWKKQKVDYYTAMNNLKDNAALGKHPIPAIRKWVKGSTAKTFFGGEKGAVAKTFFGQQQRTQHIPVGQATPEEKQKNRNERKAAQHTAKEENARRRQNKKEEEAPAQKTQTKPAKPAKPAQPAQPAKPAKPAKSKKKKMSAIFQIIKFIRYQSQ